MTTILGSNCARQLQPRKPSSKGMGILPSVATRTLAVVASLWSSTFSTIQSHDPQDKPFNLLSLRNPIPCVSAFRPELQLHHWQSCRRRYFSPTATASGKNDDDIAPTAISTSTDDATGSNSESLSATRHLPRLFVGRPPPAVEEASPRLSVGSLVPLTADQEHYLLDVVRITHPKRWRGKLGGTDHTGCVRIFNGVDGEWLAKVVVAEGDSPKKARRKRGGRSAAEGASGTVLECLELLRPQPGQDSLSNNVSIHLYLGYLKDKQRRKWVVEKATELGIDSIQILDAEYSASAGSASYKPKDVKWEADDQDKHALHAIEAAEQSERLTVPSIGANLWSVDTEVAEEVAQTTTTEGGGDEIDSNERHLWLVCLERSETSPPILTVLTEELAAATATTKTIVHLLVGPEGGWSPTELQAFSNLGIMSVSLGSSVLRAETAAITAVAAVAMFFETTTVK